MKVPRTRLRVNVFTAATIAGIAFANAFLGAPSLHGAINWALSSTFRRSGERPADLCNVIRYNANDNLDRCDRFLASNDRPQARRRYAEIADHWA